MSASFSPNNPSKKIRCLVVQFGRLGDTIQSLMALRAAKQLYPQLEIHFVAREKFASAAKRVPWLEQVVTLPTDSIVGEIVQGRKPEQQGLAELARWVAPLVHDQAWDLVINWTYSEASSYLAGILPARVKLGYCRRADGTLNSPDGWSHYIQAIVQGHIHQNIHLTDILTTQLLTALQIHYGDPKEDGNSALTSKSFFNLELTDRDIGLAWRDPSRKWIGVQLGAGRENKTWSASNWARLAALILKNHAEYGIVLLGGPEDEARAQEFMGALKTQLGDGALGIRQSSLMKRVLSLVGRAEFDLWGSVISRCQWLMAGDTAAIQLASVLGTRVLNLSLGGARLSETGPYGNGHYVVASGNPCAACDSGLREAPHSCRLDVTAEAVYGAWTYAATEWSHRRELTVEEHFSRVGMAPAIEQVRLYRTKIRGTQEGGGVVYEPLSQKSLTLHSWSAQVIGHIARAWYCGWVPPVGQELSRQMISPAFIQELRKLDESTDVLGKICDEARRTAQLLAARSSALRSDRIMGLEDRAELQEIGKKLLELDQLLERMGQAQSPLLAFGNMSKVLMHNLKGDRLADLGRQTAGCYSQLSQGAAIFREWIDHTLALAKPVAMPKLSLVRKELTL